MRGEGGSCGVSANEYSCTQEPKYTFVVAQLRSRIAIIFDRSNFSFHRVLACSAGGPGFDSRLRRHILRCSMQKDVDGSGHASTL
jgi:hypothetical protein